MAKQLPIYFICLALACTAIAIIQLDRKASRIENQQKAIIACWDNPSYIGVTPEDNRQLFEQCLADYQMAGK